MANVLPQELIEKIEQSLADGYGIRETARRLAVNKNTVTRYKRLGKYERCRCGREIGHGGWCTPRYQESSLRQIFMRFWHMKNSGNKFPEYDVNYLGGA